MGSQEESEQGKGGEEEEEESGGGTGGGARSGGGRRGKRRGSEGELHVAIQAVRRYATNEPILARQRKREGGVAFGVREEAGRDICVAVLVVIQAHL